MICSMPISYQVHIYYWLKNNCWENKSAHGQCINTAIFIEELFGWKAVMGCYHAWVITPCNKILDLTVEQYGFNHFDHIVHPNTVYDIFPNGIRKYSDDKIFELKKHNKFNSKIAKIWAINYINSKHKIPNSNCCGCKLDCPLSS